MNSSFSRYFLSLLVSVSLGLAACSGQSHNATYRSDSPALLIKANHAAADTLLKQLKDKLSPNQPLIAATLVSIDDLERSSTFGRLASEQISARFSQTGLRMIEMKFRDNVYMRRDQGELLLTREIQHVAQSHQAQAVIVGTYAVSKDAVFVNLKVIEPTTNVVMAVHDYALSKDADMRSMLR
jgi:TolB-like protein